MSEPRMSGEKRGRPTEGEKRRDRTHYKKIQAELRRDLRKRTESSVISLRAGSRKYAKVERDYSKPRGCRTCDLKKGGTKIMKKGPLVVRLRAKKGRETLKLTCRIQLRHGCIGAGQVHMKDKPERTGGKKNPLLSTPF